jgi:hypothetical protein
LPLPSPLGPSPFGFAAGAAAAARPRASTASAQQSAATVVRKPCAGALPVPTGASLFADGQAVRHFRACQSPGRVAQPEATTGGPSDGWTSTQPLPLNPI